MAERTPSDSERNGDLRVLVVARSPVVRGSFRRILMEAGYQVQECLDAVDGSDTIDRWPPDVIILSCGDGGSGGVTWATQLKASLFTASIPIVMYVPDGDPLLIAAGLDAGFDEVLSGGVDASQLLLRVRSMVSLRKHRTQVRELRALRGEQARMWNALLDFSRQIGDVQELEPLLESIVHTAAQMTCSRRVSLMLPDESQEHLRIAKAIGLSEEMAAQVRVPIGGSIAGQAFASGEAVMSLGETTPLEPVKAYPGESFVSMPIISNHLNVSHQRVGVLNVTHRYGDQPFQPWELEFVDLLGTMAGSAIDDILSRRTRESLLKLERDLQVARKIQQSTFPNRLPTLPGFEISASSEPADETGGDSYDVIGYRGDPGRSPILVTEGIADRAVLLLADATGHGIGPALSVTQVRSMLRMAVRMNPDLVSIAAHMNEQLCADLPGGRFITVWLGELNARNRTLTSFSAGQGPLVHYHAASGTAHLLPADTLPMGIVPDLPITLSDPIALEPGDVFAVISDGFTETGGNQFGVDRVCDVLTTNADETASDLLGALRQSVIAFTGGRPADDDRTALVLKRKATV